MSGRTKPKQPFKRICIDCGIEVKVFRKQRCSLCYKKWRVVSAPKRKCICDPRCQVMISSLRYDGKPNYYADGHNMRGENHWNWKGGIQKDGEYLVVYAPYHPYKRQRNTIAYHRWVYEQHYNCCLLPYTEIDHINEDKSDNRIENLRTFYKTQHTARHSKKDTSGYRCSYPNCPHPDKTYRGKDGYDKWSTDGKGGHLCNNCYQKKNSYKRRKSYKNRNK